MTEVGFSDNCSCSLIESTFMPPHRRQPCPDASYLKVLSPYGPTYLNDSKLQLGRGSNSSYSFLFCHPSVHSKWSCCVVQGHIPGLPRQSMPASTPPLQTASPLSSHLTHSLPCFLCGGWYVNILYSAIYILILTYNTFTSSSCKQIIRLSYFL